jgi:hypothetical protein
MIFAGDTEVLGENLPSATLSTTHLTWIDPGANPGLRGERPAPNRLSHGTAYRLFPTLFNSFRINLERCKCDRVAKLRKEMPHSQSSVSVFWLASP